MTIPSVRFRNIVITGASSGIGEALAADYAAPGIVLALTGRDPKRLESVAEACRAKGAVVFAEILDSTDRVGMERWLKEFDDLHPVDLLIANAGISIDQNNPALEAFHTVRRTMAVNFDGVLNTLEPLVGRMMDRRSGQIGLVSSQASFFGRPLAASYNASKAAVRVWGESVRFALAASNVGVSVVCPGFVVSRMSAETKGPKPFLVSAEKASRVIRTGLERNAPRISFPLGIAVLVWLTAVGPARWGHWVQKPAPGKQH